MTKEELIKKTEAFIKAIPDVKEEIKKVDNDIKKYNDEIETPKNEVKILEHKKLVLENKLQKLKNIMSVLGEDEQKVICYKYFENMTNSKVSRMIGRSANFCSRKRINKIIFKIGKGVFIGDIIVYGLEE
ncbi:hypothetical protein [Clostridium akagii]|uniref:hypothetical protein n=1 Tax=Clostridium akagii TaxID=91623 RepID=UPI00047E3A28|nr:hypothetical protein [Clostridium akagii]